MQKGNESADRKKSRTVPSVPFNVSLDCSWPKLIPDEKAGAFWPTSSPKGGDAGGLKGELSCAEPRARKHKEHKIASPNFICLRFLMWRIHVEDAALSARYERANEVPSQRIERR